MTCALRDDKQICDVSHILWRSSTEFRPQFSSLLCLPFFLCDISFYFVPLLNFAHTSTITFIPLYCTYLIMPHAPSLEAEAIPYSYSYSKCHNGWYIDFFNLLNMNIIHLLLWLQLLVYDDHSKSVCSSLIPPPKLQIHYFIKYLLPIKYLHWTVPQAYPA